jgi:hypothetical protein
LCIVAYVQNYAPSENGVQDAVEALDIIIMLFFTGQKIVNSHHSRESFHLNKPIVVIDEYHYRYSKLIADLSDS